jgi:hypothetical protein
MQASSYSKAVEMNLARYFTGKPCKHGHISERYMKTRTCIQCSNIEGAIRIIKNKDAQLARQKKWRDANKDRIKESARAWLQNNRHKHVANRKSREAAKIQRTPPWLNDGQKFEIECVYRYCSALREFGLDYHVDHIVPMRGENVSGLHAPWNLQVIKASENLSKNNRMEPCQDF